MTRSVVRSRTSRWLLVTTLIILLLVLLDYLYVTTIQSGSHPGPLP